MAAQQKNSIAFITMGCAKNEVDTDKMRVRLLNAGYEIVQDVSLADLVIVNTCSFLTSATQESLDAIFEVLEIQKQLNNGAKLLVAGCMPARYGTDLSNELVEVAGFISAADEEYIVEKASAVLGGSASGEQNAGEGALNDACNGAADDGAGAAAANDDDELSGAAATGSANDTKHPSLRTKDKVYAYVKISDGCDRFCSYCMIPYIRGRYKSYSLASILDEVQELVDGGVSEIVFIGQDTGIWGSDFEEPDTLVHLLKEVSMRFSNTWFRIMYTQPQGITDELLKLMREKDNICSYLDIPFQHCNSEVLKNMNREGSPEAYFELVKRIREQVPDVFLRTTFMAGFPQERFEQFEELVEFAEEASFDFAGVFPYSQEEGSKAATMSCQIEEDERIRRAQELLDLIEHVGWKRIQKQIGKIYTVLIEDYEQSDVGLEALCRMQGQAPEVDSQIHVPINSEKDLPVGAFAQVKIVDSFCYELIGELVE